jgi:TPP-dependent pyruvate/acetoin dehydrogenase alpha subunit
MTKARSSDLGQSLLTRMLRMRHFEEEVIRLAEQGLIVGNFHVYTGQEAAGAGVLAVLGEADQLVTHHRNHGHVVGREAPLDQCFAELMGRQGGIAGGRAGSVHLCAPQFGVLPTSAMLGGNVSLALGAAWSAARAKRGQVVVAFIGDASLEEGVFFEVLNVAALHKLPLLFVLENNNLDALPVHQGGVSSATTAVTDYLAIPRLFGISAETVSDGSDALAVHQVAEQAVRNCRAGHGPAFIEVRTRRWPGSNLPKPKLVTGPTDLSFAWDPPAAGEHLDWVLTHDPVVKLARGLSGQGRDTLLALDRDIRAEMEAAVSRAKNSPWPPGQAAFDHVFVSREAA